MLLIWLAAPVVIVIVALNAWLIGLAIVAARSVPPYRKPGASSRFFPLRNGLSTESRFLLSDCPSRSMFTVMFAIARTVGWVAHWQEMISDPSMRIGRPRQLYVGATRRDYLDVGRRD